MIFASSASFAVGINIGPGASIDLGDGELKMNCLDTSVSGRFFGSNGSLVSVRDVSIFNSGSLFGGASDIRLSGNWINYGSFFPDFSAVHILDGCERSVSMMTGDSTFFSFEAGTASGKTLEIAAGSTQVFLDSLSLAGLPGDRLKIRSSVPGSHAFFTLEPGGIQFIQAVDVQDNNALGGQTLAPGVPAASSSVDSGNALNWFLNLAGLEPIPTLSGSMLLALILLFGVTGWINARKFLNSKKQESLA